MYRIVERRKKNGNQDEVELGGRTEEGKKNGAPCKKLKKLWRTQKKITNYTQKVLKIMTAVQGWCKIY